MPSRLGEVEPNFANQPGSPDVERAVRRLTSFHEGDRGVIDAVACGARAIPALSALIFAREPSGLYETRRRAVEALAWLHAYDALLEYLRLALGREIADPVERTGEDAVINAVARVLADAGDPRVIPLLLKFTARPPLAGVVEALGKLHRIEALPYCVSALGEDFARTAAEAAIRSLGSSAIPSLIETIVHPVCLDGWETVSSRRRRRSALALLAGLRPEGRLTPVTLYLIHDPDPSLAALASELCLQGSDSQIKPMAVRRLVDLLSSADWLLAEEIEDCLTKHFKDAKEVIAEILNGSYTVGKVQAVNSTTVQALLRIRARAVAGTTHT